MATWKRHNASKPRRSDLWEIASVTLASDGELLGDNPLG